MGRPLASSSLWDLERSQAAYSSVAPLIGGDSKDPLE